MKKIVVLMLLLLVLVSCSNKETNTTTTNDKPTTTNDKQVPVSGKIVVNGDKYEMGVAEYQWSGDDGTKIKKIDTYSPAKVAKRFEDLTVNKNTEIKVLIRNNPKLTVYQRDKNDKKEVIKLTNNHIKVPSKSGYYLYELKGKWSHGKATYVFDINVK